MRTYTIGDSNILIKVEDKESVLDERCLICGSGGGINILFYNREDEVLLHPDCLEIIKKELEKKREKGFLIERNIQKDKVGFNNIFSVNFECPVCREKLNNSKENVVRIGRKEHIDDKVGVYIHEECLINVGPKIDKKLESVMSEIISDLI